MSAAPFSLLQRFSADANTSNNHTNPLPSLVRAQVPLLIEHWQRACILAERIVKKREAAAVRTSSLRRALHIPAHLLPSASALGLPSAKRAFNSAPNSPITATNPVLPSSSHNNGLLASPLSASSTLLPSDASMTGSYTPGMAGMSGSYAPNMSGSTTLPPLNESVLSMELGEQSDLSRLTNTLRAVVEVGAPCWRSEECELSNGVRAGLSQVAAHTQRYAEMQELRVSFSVFSLSERGRLTSLIDSFVDGYDAGGVEGTASRLRACDIAAHARDRPNATSTSPCATSSSGTTDCPSTRSSA